MDSTSIHEYNISSDFPGGAVNTSRLHMEIENSSISTPLIGIVTNGNILNIMFDSQLSTGDKTTLDGDTSNPAAGLIVVHNNSDFGSDFGYAASEGVSQTTSETYQLKLRLSTEDLQLATYLIHWYYEVWIDEEHGWSRVLLDGTDELATHHHDASIGCLIDGYTPVSGFKVESSCSGVHTIDIEYRRHDAVGTMNIRRA